MELSRLTEQIVEFDDHLSEAEIETMKWFTSTKEDVDATGFAWSDPEQHQDTMSTQSRLSLLFSLYRSVLYHYFYPRTLSSCQTTHIPS